MSFDRLILGFDKALRTLLVTASTTRGVPGGDFREPSLSVKEKAHAGALMRVNHVGEICAQALYQGQALTCRDPEICSALERAAQEEIEHLAWTERRITELGCRKSVLSPVFYLGAFSMGVFAGKLGVAWNLGFLAETERQVEAHLEGHLCKLPEQDAKSRAIVKQMKIDEASHAETAVRLGARELPQSIKAAMKLAAGGMTRTVYYF